VLAKGRNLGGENPSAARHHGTSWATVVHLRHRATGQDIAIVNVHLLHGAVQAGRTWPHRPKTYRMYTEEVKRLAQVARTERQWGRVFVLGDFNVGYTADARWHRKALPYATFTRLGMRSMWAGRKPTSHGTHRDALIDGVWATYGASRSKVAYGIRHSDHFPAIATYRLDVAP
jgi:endonuclease/exonuclease/phosphatase (EEP) superfamily protein YafD